MTIFQFDEASHTYTLDDAVIPSVTQVLGSLYDFSMVAPDVLERKRQIGQAVHKAIDLSLAGDLDESSISPDWAGYFSAWQKFLADTALTDADIGMGEAPLWHPSYRFAGTPDRLIHIGGKWAVVDIKTTAELHPAVALQLSAYRELVNINTPKLERLVDDRYALQLKENGVYRLEQYRDKNDWQVFLSLLNVQRWKERNHG